MSFIIFQDRYSTKADCVIKNNQKFLYVTGTSLSFLYLIIILFSNKPDYFYMSFWLIYTKT